MDLTYKENASAFAHAVEHGTCVQNVVRSATASASCREWIRKFAAMNGVRMTPKNAAHHMYNQSSPVDGVVVVHYSRAICHKQRFMKRLHELGLPDKWPFLQWAEHLDGMESINMRIVRKCVACSLLVRKGSDGFTRFRPGDLTQASATLNHIYAYYLALFAGWERTLILEDDAGLPDNFLAQLHTRLSRLPRGWSIYNFGCPYPHMNSPAHGGSLVCSRGYVLSRSGLVAFARRAGVVDRGADWMVHRLSATTETNTSIKTWHSGIWVQELSVRGGVKLPRTRPDDRGCNHKTTQPPHPPTTLRLLNMIDILSALHRRLGVTVGVVTTGIGA